MILRCAVNMPMDRSMFVSGTIRAPDKENTDSRLLPKAQGRLGPLYRPALCTLYSPHIPPGGRGKGETDTARITSASDWCALFAESRGKAVYGSTGRRHNRVHEKDGCVNRSSLLKRRARSGFTPESEKEDYRS
jgi:hypothetical protein